MPVTRIARGLGTALLALGLLGVAAAAGFVIAIVVVLSLSAVLPPFRPEDDETLRELVPAALSYGAWAVTTIAVFAFGWRRIRPSA